ncbi:FAD-dependent oxidoreductase [Propionibacteriaceae bacterium Y1700]|uniref:FAD-dependent oxidoreductase n=1 Tax=Microlunatus sp. Y1700 TaxID=3418487 RepID=UPI003DA7823D
MPYAETAHQEAPDVSTEHVRADVTVAGGGLAGVCAAIAAARQGATVSLIQNRPVLGGNSSSEVRVWVCGATAHGAQQYARETGIMGELWLENQFTNPDGNPYYWDLAVLEAVNAEPNITLYLNTEVMAASAHDEDGRRVVDEITGWMIGSERRLKFTSDVFIDCTGDGLVGHLVGADHRTGRERRSDFDESWAPEVPDNNTLGSTILFYSKDVGHPVKFVPPSFAVDITETAIPDRRVINVEHNGCAYWWIEWGGELDVVADNERIRDELQGVVYGIWNHIKNSGRFDADNLTLEWIGSVPGKREYRRFIGDHTLTQHDILGQTEFDDRVAFGGWSIDLHPPGGVYASERGSKHWHADGNYHVPLRSLYSRNVENLWMAGRNISASHVAFGSTRVMATCAVLGEAAGLGAALALREGVTPRALATSALDTLRRALVRSDASVIGVRDEDPANHALTARVSASSSLRHLIIDATAGTRELVTDLGMIIPVSPRLDGLELLLDAATDTEVEVEVHRTSKPQNYLPSEVITRARTSVLAGEKQWVAFDLEYESDEPENVFVVIKANTDIVLHHSETSEPGLIFFDHREPAEDEKWTDQFREWKLTLQEQAICLRVLSETEAYSADQVAGGYSRPYGGPNMWVSEPLVNDPEPWVELRWDEAVELSEVVLIMDDSLDIDLINLHHHRTPYEAMPGLLRDYTVRVEVNGVWQDVAEVTANRHRRRQHALEQATKATAVRVITGATNGAPHAHLFSLRAY